MNIVLTDKEFDDFNLCALQASGILWDKDQVHNFINTYSSLYFECKPYGFKDVEGYIVNFIKDKLQRGVWNV